MSWEPIETAIRELRAAHLYATIDDGEGGGFVGSEIGGYEDIFGALANALEAIANSLPNPPEAA